MKKKELTNISDASIFHFRSLQKLEITIDNQREKDYIVFEYSYIWMEQKTTFVNIIFTS